MRRQGALTGLAIVVAAGLAGCTEGDPVALPSAAPTTSATASSTPSPEPTPEPSPTMDTFDASVPPLAPDALDGPPSKEAAGEVAAYFMALYPYASATGDIEAWDAMSGDHCDYCSNARSIVMDQFAEGQHGVGGEIVISDMQLFDHRENEYAVLLTMRQRPWQTVDTKGNVVDESTEVTAGTADMLLRWDGSAWLVESVGLRRSSTS